MRNIEAELQMHNRPMQYSSYLGLYFSQSKESRGLNIEAKRAGCHACFLCRLLIFL
jgi:hypothetical protein